jgi:LysM repeat protein
MSKHLFSQRWMHFLMIGIMLLATSAFTITPAAAQADCGTTYTVQRGDYLSRIANTCGIPYDVIFYANPQLSNPSLLYPGQKLHIPSRINFAQGETAAKIEDQLAANSSQSYLVRALQGQLLQVDLNSNQGLQLAVYGANGTVLKSFNNGGTSFRGYLPRTQDYLMVVMSGDQKGSYTLNANVPVRISFAPNATSDQVSGQIPAHGSQYYILGARANQSLQVNITPRNGIQLSVYGVDGTVLQSSSSDEATFKRTLPSTQDYILALSSTDGAKSFDMNVTIPSLVIPNTGGPVYTVQRGDYLSLIARRFGTTVSAILELNPQITNPSLIYPGERIVLPANIIPNTGAGPAISLNPINGTGGTQVIVSGSGFPANANIGVTTSGPGTSRTPNTTTMATDEGSFSAQLTIPNQAQAGSAWTIKAETLEGGGPTASAQFQVVAQIPNAPYVIQAGDTLGGIALRFNTTVNALLRANPQITNPDQLVTGEQIYLPGSLVTLSNGKTIYIVKRGDNLSTIAFDQGTTVSKLLDLNPQIENARLVFPGERIALP